MESMASISVHTRLSAGSNVEPANKIIDRSTSQAWTGQHQNRSIPISRCAAKAPLWTRVQTRRWSLDLRWPTYLRNIILQGQFPMYPVPPSTSPISGTFRFWTCAPPWLWWSSNLMRDVHRRLVVGYIGSTPCGSDDCASHMCTRQDSHDKFFGRPPCLATVAWDW